MSLSIFFDKTDAEIENLQHENKGILLQYQTNTRAIRKLKNKRSMR
jgi:hypothetical protein